MAQRALVQHRMRSAVANHAPLDIRFRSACALETLVEKKRKTKEIKATAVAAAGSVVRAAAKLLLRRASAQRRLCAGAWHTLRTRCVTTRQVTNGCMLSSVHRRFGRNSTRAAARATAASAPARALRMGTSAKSFATAVPRAPTGSPVRPGCAVVLTTVRAHVILSVAGCACAKGQCRTRACPCFAAARECDPDLCRRCTPTALRAWAAGGGAHVPSLAPGDDCCENMKLQLRQHKHLLLGRSSVSGWGAFVKARCVAHTLNSYG